MTCGENFENYLIFTTFYNFIENSNYVNETTEPQPPSSFLDTGQGDVCPKGGYDFSMHFIAEGLNLQGSWIEPSCIQLNNLKFWNPQVCIFLELPDFWWKIEGKNEKFDNFGFFFILSDTFTQKFIDFPLKTL